MNGKIATIALALTAAMLTVSAWDGAASRSDNHRTTGDYHLPQVKAELKINVKEETGEVHFIQDKNDPFVITKAYMLKAADPYVLRGYVRDAISATQIDSSPVQVTALKYKDGSGVLLISAEKYRFLDSGNWDGIDSIVAKLDHGKLLAQQNADLYVYFPKHLPAATLRNMLDTVGSHNTDVEFAEKPGTLRVDGELNLLMFKGTEWEWLEITKMLKQYDKPMPEAKVNYRILEIYAENDDRIGVDFQSWKNNDGVDFFSAGARIRRNWSSFYTGGVNNNGSNNTRYWNFNPKWNTRYLDFLTSIGKARILSTGQLLVKNREMSRIYLDYGYFYERTDYSVDSGYGMGEFAYTDPNPDTIQRQQLAKIMPEETLRGILPYIYAAGFTPRMMGALDGAITWKEDTSAPAAEQLLANLLLNYYQSHQVTTSEGMPGIIHGKIQYPMAQKGFSFEMSIRPVVTSNAAKLHFYGGTVSLLGWNSDGSPRNTNSHIATTCQIDNQAQEFVIGGLTRTETVRSVAGLPFLKDIPVLGLLFSTENESIKQSQLVIVATVELVPPTSGDFDEKTENKVRTVIQKVNRGVDSKVGNMFFQQYKIDTQELK